MRSALLWALLAVPAGAAGPAKERVVLRTNFGDISFTPFSDGAPRHTRRLFDMVRAGDYDAAPIEFVDPARLIRLTPTGAAAFPDPLAPETGAELFRPGTVVSVRGPGKSGASSLAILLARIPAMDGRYTALGEVSGGLDVLEGIGNLPRDAAGRPVAKAEVVRAFVVLPVAAAAGAWILPGLLLAAGLAMHLTGRRARWRLLDACGLMATLGGFFLVYAAYAPQAAQSRWMGAGLMAGALAVLWLMARFEMPESESIS